MLTTPSVMGLTFPDMVHSFSFITQATEWIQRWILPPRDWTSVL